MRVQLDPDVRAMPEGVRIAVAADEEAAALLYATRDNALEERCADTGAAISALMQPPRMPGAEQRAPEPDR